jgi:hypothetical protein
MDGSSAGEEDERGRKIVESDTLGKPGVARKRFYYRRKGEMENEKDN